MSSSTSMDTKLSELSTSFSGITGSDCEFLSIGVALTLATITSSSKSGLIIFISLGFIFILLSGALILATSIPGACGAVILDVSVPGASIPCVILDDESNDDEFNGSNEDELFDDLFLFLFEMVDFVYPPPPLPHVNINGNEIINDGDDTAIDFRGGGNDGILFWEQVMNRYVCFVWCFWDIFYPNTYNNNNNYILIYVLIIIIVQAKLKVVQHYFH